jgi:hypothetical protein
MDKEQLDIEFTRFRRANERMQRIVLNFLFLNATILGLIRWYRDIPWNIFSIEMIFAILVVFFGIFIPRISYMLTRHVVGYWYKSEFGIDYTEFCKNEKISEAKELSENEI